MAPVFNAPAPNTPYFIPRQYPPAGTAFKLQPDGKPIPSLFKPLKIRGVELHNRIWVCLYSRPQVKLHTGAHDKTSSRLSASTRPRTASSHPGNSRTVRLLLHRVPCI